MNMKRLFLLLGAAALLVTSSFAEGFTRDGNWWRSQQKQVKAAYVTGQIDGVHVGMAAFAKIMLTKEDIPTKDFLASFAKDTPINGDSDAALLTAIKRYFVGVKVEQVVDGLDRFYSDKSNRGISTTDLLWMAVFPHASEGNK
jgi:hypothetical protein